jgi:hypothetical protein
MVYLFFFTLVRFHVRRFVHLLLSYVPHVYSTENYHKGDRNLVLLTWPTGSVSSFVAGRFFLCDVFGKHESVKMLLRNSGLARRSFTVVLMVEISFG